MGFMTAPENLTEALQKELTLTQETPSAFAKRAGVGHYSVVRILQGHGCGATTLKRIEAASGGRVGLHSVALPEVDRAEGS